MTTIIGRCSASAYHDLSVAVGKRSRCITADGVLAVPEPASERVLHLEKDGGGTVVAAAVAAAAAAARTGLEKGRGRGAKPPSYLPAQDAVYHDDDEALQRVEDGKEDLKEDGTLVRHGQHRRHPGEGQQRQDHAGAPERRPEQGGEGGTRKKKKRKEDWLTLVLTPARAHLQGIS